MTQKVADNFFLVFNWSWAGVFVKLKSLPKICRSATVNPPKVKTKQTKKQHVSLTIHTYLQMPIMNWIKFSVRRVLGGSYFMNESKCLKLYFYLATTYSSHLILNRFSVTIEIILLIDLPTVRTVKSAWSNFESNLYWAYTIERKY